MTLTHEHIQLISLELQNSVCPSLVNKVRKGFQKEILLELYWQKSKQILVIGLNPNQASLHLAEKKDVFTFKADRFTMFLRKFIHRKILEKIEAVPGERIVILHFHEAPKLILHLFPRGGNVFAVDPENDRILQALVSVSEKFYSELEMAPSGVPKESDAPIDMPDLAEIGKNYHDAQKKHMREFLIQQQRRANKKNRQALKRKLANIKKDYDNCLKSERFHNYASILSAYFGGDKRKGLKSIDSYDFEGNSIELPLNPKYTIQENATRYFEKSKKLSRALPILEERLLNTEEELEKLNRLEVDENLSLEELKARFQKSDPGKRDKWEDARELLIFENEKGFRFYVGRNSEENDFVFKMARGRDMWFHNRDYPGSHVVLKVERNQEIDAKTKQEGAFLALFYSKSRKHGEGFVMQSYRKFLSRTPGMPAGKVNVSRYKSVLIQLEEDQFPRLKKVHRKG